MIILETIKHFEKQGNKWILTKEYPQTEITETSFLRRQVYKPKYSRIYKKTNYEIGGYLMYKQIVYGHDFKAVYEFEFKSEV